MNSYIRKSENENLKDLMDKINAFEFKEIDPYIEVKYDDEENLHIIIEDDDQFYTMLDEHAVYEMKGILQQLYEDLVHFSELQNHEVAFWYYRNPNQRLEDDLENGYVRSYNFLNETVSGEYLYQITAFLNFIDM